MKIFHMASTDSEEVGEFYHLQPQLLTKEGLIELLELRCVKLRNIHTMSKDELVEVFLRVGVPLPQRTYRDNRRGKLLTKLRAKQESKKQKSVEKDSNVSVGFNEASTSRYQGCPSSGDRLKPPPNPVNYERKKIRLNSTSSSKSEDLDKIKIKRARKDEITNGNCQDETHKKSSNNGEQLDDENIQNSCTNDNEKMNTSAKIVLKRSHSSTLERRSSSDTEPDSKKGKKKITWP